MNVYEQVEKNIDELVDNNVDWSACATSEEMHNAREGKLSIKFFDKEVPADWLKDIKGRGCYVWRGQADCRHLCLHAQERK